MKATYHSRVNILCIRSEFEYAKWEKTLQFVGLDGTDIHIDIGEDGKVLSIEIIDIGPVAESEECDGQLV